MVQKESQRAENLLRLLAEADQDKDAMILSQIEAIESNRKLLFTNTCGEDISNQFLGSGFGLEDIPMHEVVTQLEIALTVHSNPLYYKQSILLALVRLLFDVTMSTVKFSHDVSDQQQQQQQATRPMIDMSILKGQQIGSMTFPPIANINVFIGQMYCKYGDFDELKELAVNNELPEKPLQVVKDFLKHGTGQAGTGECLLKGLLILSWIPTLID